MSTALHDPRPRDSEQAWPQLGGKSYIAELKAKLSIAPEQARAWEVFADVLSANGRRIRCGSGESPFGPLAHRLAARSAMKHAAERLLAALEPAQRRTAVQMLPLCCLQ
jgi:hypothetical protein